jgi:hypothetical protein
MNGEMARPGQTVGYDDGYPKVTDASRRKPGSQAAARNVLVAPERALSQRTEVRIMRGWMSDPESVQTMQYEALNAL